MRLTRFLLALAIPALLVALVQIQPAVALGEDIPLRVQIGQLAKPVPIGGAPGEPGKTLSQAEQDKKALDSAKLKEDDTAGLLAYLKARTISDADLAKIDTHIKKLGDESFEDRIKAEEALIAIGLPAITPLKKVADVNSSDYEVSYRARSCLKRIEKVPQSEVASAVVRALAKQAKPEVIPALIAYISIADDRMVLAEIQRALTANALKDGKAQPSIVEAMTDKNATRRLIATLALIEGPKPGERIDAYPKILEAAKNETDVNAKFEMTKSLLMKAREKEAMAWVISTIPDMNRTQSWQFEDWLTQIGGKDAPKIKFLKAKDSNVKVQTIVKEWWDKNSDKIDLAKLDLKPRVMGSVVLLTIDYSTGARGGITEMDSNDKVKWSYHGGDLMNPSDIIFNDDGTFWVSDQNTQQVTKRDTNGKVLTTLKFEADNGGWKGAVQPRSMQRLENGNLFVIGANAVAEFDKDGKEVVKYNRPPNQNWGNHDIMAACRMQDGKIMVAVQNNGPNGQKPQIIFVDEKGKEIKEKVKEGDKEVEKTKAINTGMCYNYMSSLIQTGKDKVIFTENTRLVEYDLSNGKVLWERASNNPRNLQILHNGNMVYMDNNSYNMIKEMTRDGEEVWSHTLQNRSGNMNLLRAVIR